MRFWDALTSQLGAVPCCSLLYEHGVLAAGLCLTLVPHRCVPPSLRGGSRPETTRLLGVWMIAAGLVVREAREGRSVPHHFLPLYALLSLAVPVRRALLHEEFLPWKGSALVAAHITALLMQTVGLTYPDSDRDADVPA
eukprot:TRINITY_DN38458_c0_g1_i1.p1 TRINITY_DN38458_c0_g1~~TRINITY_DN38458_c0_g1_i1.p1  ORF type:complete len:139 (+),score=33.95 TRINITY_DN38458_c0_g1_i1:27-443(+)